MYHSIHSSSSVDLYISFNWSRSLGCRRKSSVSSGEVAIDAGVDLSAFDKAPSVVALFWTPFSSDASVLMGVDDSLGPFEICGLGAQ